MNFEVVTLFPEMFKALNFGITGRAQQNNIININYWNPRDYASDKYRRVDDRPYGGGPGMVMMVEPLHKTVEAIKSSCKNKSKVIHLSPRGRVFNQKLADKLAKEEHLILIATRYEGVDQRFIDMDVDEEISVGDYVVSGGDIPIMLLIDAVTRLLPGALGNEDSALQDSFSGGLLDCPHYTRPEKFLDHKVPDVLLSGDHAAIAKWRAKAAHDATAKMRPDLLEKKT
ncbi:MAG: tRNA (guanosine(37)-N1)-methyltransferase TrmD [Gammaproteobacteria bacterium]|nr:tRNA (guanosine(37)-N1)-methyltransferase TrmD [Gammaproteobacteria bacterium]